ncbi:hypothetical protein B0H13DRAFT_1877837 [Mycena leptocephala]|nr:hypothetical protein B0H13DRAFT_1877837 [Mycena leptocephala]
MPTPLLSPLLLPSFNEPIDARTNDDNEPEHAVLSRLRTRHYGPTDSHPRTGTAAMRVKAAADETWRQHLRGQAPAIRPGSIVAPQTLYTGSWELEVPYPTDENVDNAMGCYGLGAKREVSRQRRRGQYKLTKGRKVQRNTTSQEHESEVSEGWRPSHSPPLHAPTPLRLIAPPSTLESNLSRESTPAFRYITHPVGVQPPMDTSSMEVVGTSADSGDRVLRYNICTGQPGNRRPDTPNLPCKLLEKPPALIATNEGRHSPTSEIPFLPYPDMPMLPRLWDKEAPQPEWEKPLAGVMDVPLERLRPGGLHLTNHLITSAPYVFSMFQTSESAEEPARKVLKGMAEPDVLSCGVGEKEEAKKIAPPSIGLAKPSPAQPEMPVYGSGKRGPIVTRDYFSSSPSNAATESSDSSQDIFSPQTPFRTSVPTFVPSRDPRKTLRQILWKPQTRPEVCSAASTLDKLLTADIQNHKENTDNSSSAGSPPPLESVMNSSESGEEDPSQNNFAIDDSSSEAENRETGGEIEVEVREVHQTLSALRHRPPTPFSDENLQGLAWVKIYRELQDAQTALDTEKDREDAIVLRPLWDALHVINGQLQTFVDKVAMSTGDMVDADAVEHLTQSVSGQWKDARTRVSSELDSTPEPVDPNEQAIATNQILDMISSPAGEGKRKIRDEPHAPYFGLPKHQLTGDALRHHMVYRTSVQVEWMRRKSEMEAIADLDFTRSNTFAVHAMLQLAGDGISILLICMMTRTLRRPTCTETSTCGCGSFTRPIDAKDTRRFRETVVLRHVLYNGLFDEEIARQKAARIRAAADATATYCKARASFNFSFLPKAANDPWGVEIQGAIRKTRSDNGDKKLGNSFHHSHGDHRVVRN